MQVQCLQMNCKVAVKLCTSLLGELRRNMHYLKTVQEKLCDQLVAFQFHHLTAAQLNFKHAFVTSMRMISLRNQGVAKILISQLVQK